MSNLMTEPHFREVGMTAPEIREPLESILRDRRSGVLATCLNDVPLCSQMAFAVSEDLHSLIMITPRNTTKFDNMAANPNVSFLVSTVRNAPSDSEEAMALTVEAAADELTGEHAEPGRRPLQPEASGPRGICRRTRQRGHEARGAQLHPGG